MTDEEKQSYWRKESENWQEEAEADWEWLVLEAEAKAQWKRDSGTTWNEVPTGHYHWEAAHWGEGRGERGPSGSGGYR